MSDMEWFVNSLRPYVAKIKDMGGVVTARQVQRRLWTFRHNGQCLLQSLVNHGFGRWEDRRPGPKGGRPTKVFVLIDKTPTIEAAEDAV